ncbi:MAG: hypothetical protein U0441_39115 [Polyangiaceae bacterium]
MKSTPLAGSTARAPRALAALSLLGAALFAAGCNGKIASGDGGTGGGASGGSGGSTATETHGCPDLISSPMPCYDPGLKCGYPDILTCGSSGSYWVCTDWSEYWQYGHIDTLPCTCPETLPADGDPCNLTVVPSQCTYTLPDCSDVEIVAQCSPSPNAEHTWSVPTAVCP